MGGVSVPLPGFSGLRLDVPPSGGLVTIEVSVPLPGFSGLRLLEVPTSLFLPVSVPLPGFSGLRLTDTAKMAVKNLCFSPVAGIQWVETQGLVFALSLDRCKFQSRCRDSVG